MTAAYKQVREDEKYGYDKDGNSKNPKDKKKARWQDDDGDGKWYEKSDVDGKISKREKEEKKKNQKEEVEVVGEKISASGYARAKKYREDQARQKDRDDNAKWEEKARTHKWDGKTWNKRDKPTHEKGTGPHAKKASAANEEVEVVNEISPDLALKASKEADKKRGKLAAAGDKEGAAKKNAQAGRLYKAQAKKRLNREETEILDDLLESGLFTDEEIESILKMNEEE